MMTTRALLPITIAVALAMSAVSHGYSSYARWSSVPVTVLVNPANADLSASATISAVQFAMNVWNTQSGSSFRFQYGGTATDTATAHDNRNVLIFRNVSNGSTIGTTYSWWDSSNTLLDSDVIFWDGGFTFFTGTSGCGVVMNAVYLEDIATHELGHVLGLNHSTYSDATMYPNYGYCSQEFRTLASDDINAARALYPASTAPNTPPTVVITSPANGATYSVGAPVSLAATATDSQDGTISSKVQWTDNGTAIGSGSALSTVLSVAGTHTFTAKVTDSGGLTGTSQVSVSVSALSGSLSQGSLSVTGRRVKGWDKADLRWTGLTASSVDVLRNGTKVSSPSNTGAYTDNINSKSTGTYSYTVCAAGTTTCTNQASVTF